MNQEGKRRPSADVAQPRWLDVKDQSYRVWDAVLDGKRWFQKLTAKGYQYASEPKDKSYPIKVFMTTQSWQGKLPRELTPTGVVFGTQNRDATEVEEAFRIGYREFDTAESYRNIQEVAEGLSIARERREYRIIYKFDLRKQGEHTQHLRRVAGLFHNFLDVAMVHNLPESSEQLSAAVKELSRLKEQTLIGKVGLSGVEPDHVKSGAIRGVDTIENDVEKPGTDEVTRKLCQERGIEYLGHGIPHLIDESVQSIAQKHDTTATALILAWAQSQNIRPLMSSSRTAQRTENARAWHTQVKPAAVEELSVYFSKRSTGSTRSTDDLRNT
jgi:2,5-diketo-D-gluconate reductase B